MFRSLVLSTAVVGLVCILPTDAYSEYRELILTLGDIDGGVYGGAGSIDHVPVDPDWLAAVNANTPSTNPERPFDFSQINQNVPFTFTFDLEPTESVVSAWLTLGLQGTADGAGGIASDAVIFGYDPPLGPYYYDDLGWRPFSQDRVRIRSVNLSDINGENVLGELQDGHFNVLVRDDSMVDYARLTLGIIPEPSIFALLGVGAVGLLAHGWRRRKKA